MCVCVLFLLFEAGDETTKKSASQIHEDNKVRQSNFVDRNNGRAVRCAR